SFSSRPFSVNAHYDHVLAGDLDGMNGDEMLWYSSASGAAHIWWSRGDGSFDSQKVGAAPGQIPFLLDSDGDRRLEIFWYGPGSVPDSHWFWTGSEFAVTDYTLTRSYVPFVGDFDGNGRQDIFWYGRGSIPDAVWYYAQAGGFTSL